MGHHNPASLSSSNVDDLHSDQQETPQTSVNCISHCSAKIPNQTTNIHILFLKHWQIPQSILTESAPAWKSVFESTIQLLYPSLLTSSMLFMHKQNYPSLSSTNVFGLDIIQSTKSSDLQIKNEKKENTPKQLTKSSEAVRNGSGDSAVALHCSQNSPSFYIPSDTSPLVNSSIFNNKTGLSTNSLSNTSCSSSDIDQSFSILKKDKSSVVPSLITKTISHACHLENKKGCEAAKAENWCQAVKHWTNAAGLNYPPAQFNLAVYYHTNFQDSGDKTECSLAKQWYNLASSAGHKEAKEYLNVLSNQILDWEILNRYAPVLQKESQSSSSRVSSNGVKPSLGSLSRWSYPALPITSYSVSRSAISSGSNSS